jgi:stage V sporulation protein B
MGKISMSNSKKSFVGGAAILAAAGLIGKVIGMFYRVWLTDLITSEGMGLYGTPYSVYSFLLVLSSAGLPTAISKMVSERLVGGDRQGAKLILKKTRRILLCTGLVATAIMASLAEPIAGWMGDPASAKGFVALAPSIFFVCLISSYRGYFQGAQNMTPTAVSQLIEVVGKVVFGFALVKLMAPYGLIWGAVAAILGVTLAELCALLFMMARYYLAQRREPREALAPAKPIPHFYQTLFAIAIPVTIGAAMMPIVNLVDASLVTNRLTHIGYVLEDAREMYGVLTGMVNTMVNMPAVITLSFSMSLVPAVSSALTRGDRAGLNRMVGTGLKLALMIGSAAAVGMGLLSHQILRLLYASQPENCLEVGGELLAIMSVGVLFLALVQTTTGMLQGLGKPGYPVKTLAAGIVVKIILNYVLIGLPQLNVLGAAYATVACYAIAAVGNVFMVLKLSGTRLRAMDALVRPALAAGGMAAAVFAFLRFMGPRLGNTLLTLGAVCVGVLVYGVLVFVLRALSPDDLSLIPGGRRIMRLMNKFGGKKA